MSSIANHACVVHPVAVHDFFDKIELRLPRRPDDRKIAAIDKHCRPHHGHDGCFIKSDKPLPPPYSYRPGCTLVLVAPDARALEIAATLPGAKLIHVEPALDLITGSESDKWTLYETLVACFVQGWHGRHHCHSFDAGHTTGQDRNGRRFMNYADRPSKLTHEPNCVHFEGRYRGHDAVRRLGIGRIEDLQAFDHAAYWRRNMTLYQVDVDALHAYLRRTGTIMSRQQLLGAITCQYQHREGSYTSSQLCVDYFGRKTSYLYNLDASPLMPRRIRGFID